MTKQKREQIIKWIYLFCTGVIVIFMANAQAAKGSYICKTLHEEKIFHINLDSVAIVNPAFSNQNKRAISSVSNIRTTKTPSGFTKNLYFEGIKYSIHIENIESFSEVDDYVTLTSKEGHQMIYPLICQ